MRPKEARWDHLSHSLATNPKQSEMCKLSIGPKLAMNHPLPLATTRGHQPSSAHPSPQLKGKSFHSSMVQEWTQFHDSKSRAQNPTPILKEDSSAHQYGNPWWLPEDHPRNQPHGPAGVGLAIHSGLFQGQFSEVITHFNQLSRHQVFQYSLDSSIGPYRWQSVNLQSVNLYVLGPIGPIHIPLWEFNHTVSISRWPELYWLNSDNTAGDSPSRVSPSNFHIY
ncbi:hypothetical protein O181_056438 [Austropuccinia psidii MF-1]|uniref:Uncharacterized protein n=1 Tax=Austropuccinia psidii MF-1 TaxID=1389203 RepID=A0A9Q3E9L0_9BASI|nr:hypothetical protein [Austropuccinia psidii MF-1]